MEEKDLCFIENAEWKHRHVILYDKRFVTLTILSRQQSRVGHVSITCTIEIRNFLSANQIELESRRGFFKLGFKLGLDPFRGEDYRLARKIFWQKKRRAPLFSRSFLDFCVLIIFERVSIPHYTRDVLPSKCAPILVCSSNRFVSMLNCLVKLSSGNVSTGN